MSTGDAYGNFTLPGQTFEVLRQKRTTYKSVALDVKVAPLGWIDLSTIGLQPFFPLGTDTITSFTYYNPAIKEPIAEILTNTQQNAIIKA